MTGLALALVDGHGVEESTAAIGYAVFVAAMTAGHLLGPDVLDRFGRVMTLRASIGLSVAGTSAAADHARSAAARVGVVASFGYIAFLAGPPTVGWLGDRLGVQHALVATIAVMLPALVVLPAVREPGRRW